MTLIVFLLAVSTLVAYALVKRSARTKADAVVLVAIAVSALVGFAADVQLLRAFSLAIGLGSVATIVWLNVASLFERKEVVPATPAVAG
jgi:hypothetical protein